MSIESLVVTDFTHAFPATALLPAVEARSLRVELARSREEIRAAQRLRYTIFAGEMGARLHNRIPDLDHDRFDQYCQHLIVRDALDQVVGCMVIPATDLMTVPENPALDATGASGDHSPVLSAPMTPYRWAALALRSLETTEEEGGALGRLSRWVDAVIPWRPPPISPGTAFPKRVVLPPPPPALAPTREENRRCRPVAPC